MKTFGVIGGLGPMSTVYFLELVTKLTPAGTDQEHMPMVVMSIPDTPDRTAYILDHKKANPLPKLVAAGRALKDIGVEYLAIPCVTAHFFHEALCVEIGLPIISLPIELALMFRRQGIECVGILATDGTVQSAFLQKEFQKYGIDTVIPEEPDQNTVMDVIFHQVKAGREIKHMPFIEVGERLKQQGAQKLLLGCTELSLLKKDQPSFYEDDYTDALEVLAGAAIKYNTEVMDYIG